MLKDHEIRISMDGRGRATDNIVIERFWRSLKHEDIYPKDYETVDKLNAGLREYFEWYNNSRSHQTLDGSTPAEIYNGVSLKRVA
ncbi:MAG: integrase core domain-containing protein [Bacteroidales bacterium]|nr:integrase core domain-containing protein [Candidatus Latescibacterota bacterium]